MIHHRCGGRIGNFQPARRHPYRHHSLKKEDKGPVSPWKRIKNKRRPTKPKKYIPPEINPFEDSSPFQESIQLKIDRPVPGRIVDEKSMDDAYDAEEVERDPVYQAMMKHLVKIEAKYQLEVDSDIDVEMETLKENDPDLDELTRDPGLLLENIDDILDFDDETESEKVLKRETDDEWVDFTLDELESREFLNEVKEIETSDFIEQSSDSVKAIEQKIAKKRLEKIPTFPSKYDEQKWEHPYDQLMWDVVRLLLPKKGKKAHRQNWDHIHVSEEVKQKRAAKKARGYSIWLSMEISKDLKAAFYRLSKAKGDTDRRDKAIGKALWRFNGYLMYQEHKFNLRNVVAMLHGIGHLVDQAGNGKRLLLWKYGNLIMSLFGMVEDELSTTDGRCISELIWTLQKLGAEALEITALSTTKSVERAIDLRFILSSLIHRAADASISFSASDIVIIIHSLVCIDWPDAITADLMSRLLERADKLVHEFGAQNLSVMIWCIAKMDGNDQEERIAALVKRAVQISSSFGPQSIANTIHSLAVLKYHACIPLCHALSAPLEQGAEEFSPQELGCTLWGMAKLRYLPSSALLTRVATVSIEKMEAFSLQNTANLALAYASFEYRHAALFVAIRSKIVFHNGSSNSQDYANIVWAFAIVGLLEVEFARFCLKKLSEIQTSIVMEQKLQIYQSFIHCSVYFPKTDVFRILSPQFIAECRACWVSSQTSSLSAVMEEIVDFLNSEGYDCNVRHGIAGDAFQVTTVTINGIHYVLECLRDDMRFQNQPDKLSGKNSWRENILIRFGYFVLRIQPAQWNALTTEEQRRKFIKRIM